MMFKKNAVHMPFCFFVLCTIRPLRGQMYTRLCKSLSEKASNQQLKLCGKTETKLEVVRMKRDVSNSTPQTNQNSIASTSMPVITTKRSLDSYTCKDQATSPNGFSPDGEGLNLTVKCYKDQNWWSAIVSWEIPKSKAGRADVVGYVIKWEESNWNIFSGTRCDYITNKNVTSYVMDSSKGWTNPKHGGDGGLWIAVFPLPLTSNDSVVSISPYWPSECAVVEDTAAISSFQSSIPSTTEMNVNASSDVTGTPTPMSTEPKVQLAATGLNWNSKAPVVNKLVFAIVIAVIAVVIVVISFAVIFRKRWKQVGGDSFVKKLRGSPHYISYDLDNKTEAKNIARWLNAKNINVVIDMFSVIKSNPRAWSEEQLSVAERIIIIITPRYLEIISFHQSKKERKFGDELAYNEISVIKNNLTEKPLASDKYVVILHDTKQKHLPHWMSHLNCYEYKSGKLDDEILSKLKPSKVSEEV